MFNTRWNSPLISYRVARVSLAACLLACGLAWAVHRQLDVEEIHLADSPRNLPLAILRPTDDDWPGAFGAAGLGRCARDRLPAELGVSSRLTWQVPITGTGEAGASVWGDLVVIPVVDSAAGTISLEAVHRRDGHSVWKAALH